jgi:hypothetical protein
MISSSGSGNEGTSGGSVGEHTATESGTQVIEEGDNPFKPDKLDVRESETQLLVKKIVFISEISVNE